MAYSCYQSYQVTNLPNQETLRNATEQYVPTASEPWTNNGYEYNFYDEQLPQSNEDELYDNQETTLLSEIEDVLMDFSDINSSGTKNDFNNVNPMNLAGNQNEQFYSTGKTQQYMPNSTEEPHVEAQKEKPKPKCKICPKQYNFRADLKLLMFVYNQKTTPYTCPQCGKGAL